MNRTGQGGGGIIVDITGRGDCRAYNCFARGVMSILVHENRICYPKEFRNIFGKHLISVHDTGLIKYRVCNEMYARNKNDK